MANTRIKIKREDMVDKLKTTRAAHLKNHEKATLKYQSDVDKCQSKIREALQRAIHESNHDFDTLYKKLNRNYHGQVTVDLGKLNLPSEPACDTRELDRMIRVLEASCDDTISVAVGDAYARYL